MKLQQVSDVLEEDRALLRSDSQARGELPAMEVNEKKALCTHYPFYIKVVVAATCCESV